MTAQEKVDELLDMFRPHSQYWDCYNDCSLEENHTKHIAIISVNETLATLKRLRATTDVFVEYRFYLEVKIILEKL